jgi:hypothetical protein
MKPRPGVNTSRKGWMDNRDNIQYDEHIEITRGIKRSSDTAKIILNLSDKTVIRNTFGTDREFKEFFKYYFGGYHEYLITVMRQLDQVWLEAMVSETEAEIKQTEDNADVQEVPSV